MQELNLYFEIVLVIVVLMALNILLADTDPQYRRILAQKSVSALEHHLDHAHCQLLSLLYSLDKDDFSVSVK